MRTWYSFFSVFALIFFGLFFFAVSSVTAANSTTSSISVTQTVVDNSTNGGGSGGGSAGSGASGDSKGLSPAPTKEIESSPEETTLAPVEELVQKVAEDPTVKEEVPAEQPVEPAKEPVPEASISVPKEAASEISFAQVSEVIGQVVIGVSQAVNVISENLSEAVEVVAQVVTEQAEKIVKNVVLVSTVVARNTGEVVRSPVGRAVTKVVEPVGVVSGSVAVGSQVLISTTTVTSLSDIYLLTIRTIGLIFGVFRKKRRPWGTVYDSVTKRPLDPAYVTITKEGGEEVGDAITDLDGRFGFFLPTGGRYVLTAGKTNYAFPSKTLSGRSRDELYENLYFGESVESREGEVIARNIPLDPTTFDWNEFEKNKRELFRFYSEKEKKWKTVFNSFYRVGLLGAMLAVIFDANYFNYSFLVFYLVINIYQIFFAKKRMAVTLKYAVTNEPIPYSIVKLFSAKTLGEVKSAVSDHLGRFYLLVGPGEYYVTVAAKQPDASYKEVYKSGIMNLNKGIIDSDIVVPNEGI